MIEVRCQWCGHLVPKKTARWNKIVKDWLCLNAFACHQRKKARG